MANSGADRVELMETLNIKVIDGVGDGNLILSRYNIMIPYNITNFMLFNESYLISDVLRRFREKQMDDDPVKRLNDWWDINRRENELDNMISAKPIQESETIDPLIEKKQNIRNILTDKGLVCSESE